MSDNRTISGSVRVEDNSREAVAFRLMQKIGEHEHAEKQNNREYWLTLYRQCHKAVVGNKLDTILLKD